MGWPACTRLLAERADVDVWLYGPYDARSGATCRGGGVLLWRVAVLPAMDQVALDQLPAVMLHCLALDVAAHWLLLR